jgi:hypothetical protein
MKALISKLLDKPMTFCDAHLGGPGCYFEVERDAGLELRLRKAAIVAAAKMEEWRWRCRERF